MARKTRPESVYTIRIHKNGGYLYACTHTFTLNANGTRQYKVTHWGKLTEDLQFIPGKHYWHTPSEERDKLIFPKEWDLCRIRTTNPEDNMV